MPTFIVKYDWWNYDEVVVGQDPDFGDDIIEEQEESGSDSCEVEAQDETDARDVAWDVLFYEYDDIDIYSVSRVED